ncbi:MAG: TRAP transporter substrate-binding protein [Deltaproteobacteria bacterium]|nr:TRAP transporter substrate-binding protein [Deltaproteobacteria bacterium]
MKINRVSKFKIFLMVLLLILINLQNSWGTLLRLGHTYPKDYPTYNSAFKYAEMIKKETNGKYEIKLYPGGQLGSGRTLVKSVRSGIIEMCIVSSSTAEYFLKELALLKLPFIFKNYKHVDSILDGDIGLSLLNLFKNQNIKGLTFLEQGFLQISNAKRAIKNVNDLKGLTIRVYPSKIQEDTFRILGASPVIMPFAEVYTALQQGVVDGDIVTINSFKNRKFYEVQKYLSLTKHSYRADILLFNNDIFNKLSNDYQVIFQKVAKEISIYQRDFVREKERKTIKSLKKLGIMIIEPDREAMKKMVEPIYNRYPMLYESIRDYWDCENKCPLPPICCYN